jgi:hypothetical protein
MAHNSDSGETGAGTTARAAEDGSDRAATGIEGLDEVLGVDSPAVDCILCKALQVQARPRWRCSFCSRARRAARAVC